MSPLEPPFPAEKRPSLAPSHASGWICLVYFLALTETVVLDVGLLPSLLILLESELFLPGHDQDWRKCHHTSLLQEETLCLVPHTERPAHQPVDACHGRGFPMNEGTCSGARPRTETWLPAVFPQGEILSVPLRHSRQRPLLPSLPSLCGLSEQTILLQPFCRVTSPLMWLGDLSWSF